MLRSACSPAIVRAVKLALGAFALLSLVACNKTDKMGLATLGGTNGARIADNGPSLAIVQQTGEWAAKYAKNPRDPAAGINYARHLRAIGSNDKALEVLSQTAQANPGNAAVSADFGRSALEANDLALAERELSKAEQGGLADWRTLSALGTLNAKKDNQGKARDYYEAALRKNPGAASVKNNLALSYALDGKPDKAEALMRDAASTSDGDARVRQNLALILGVQGKKAEAKNVADAVPSAEARLRRRPQWPPASDEDPDPKVDAAGIFDPAMTGTIAPQAQTSNALPRLPNAAQSDPTRPAFASSAASSAAGIAPGPSSQPESNAPQARVMKARSRIRWPWSRRTRPIDSVAVATSEANAGADAPSGWTTTVSQP